jgi:hypothetical protein
LPLKTNQKASPKYPHFYPAIEMIFPKENSTANLAGLPVARLKNEPKESSCMI